MQADGCGFNPLPANAVQHVLGEMQAGRRRCDRAADMGVERLVTLRVDGLGLAVQVRRDGNGAGHLQYAGERRTVLPVEADHARLAFTSFQDSLQAHFLHGGVAVGII